MELIDALTVLRPAIYEAWSQIGTDILECADSCGDSLDNYEAVEACLDADRLLLVCNNETAHSLVKSLYKQHSYHAVLQFLAKHIQLH